MSFESKTFKWPENNKQPEKADVLKLENVEKVKNSYLIKNIQFIDQYERMKKAEKEYKADEANENKKKAYLKEKKYYEGLKDDISHLELMDGKPIPDEYFSLKTRDDFINELENRDFTDAELAELGTLFLEHRSGSSSGSPSRTAAGDGRAEETPPPLPVDDNRLSIQEMEQKLKFAKDTARPLETAYWEEKIKQKK